MDNKRKKRITISVNPEMARLVALQSQQRRMTQSEIVAQAIGEWLERREAEDRGEVAQANGAREQAARLEEAIARGVDRLAALSQDHRRATEMVYALVETSSNKAAQQDRQQIRKRAIDNMRSDRRQPTNSAPEPQGDPDPRPRREVNTVNEPTEEVK